MRRVENRGFVPFVFGLVFGLGSAKVGWFVDEIGCGAKGVLRVGGRMGLLRLVTVSALAVAWAMMAGAQEQVWVQIESYPSEETARARATAYAGEFPDVQVMSGGAWHAIVLGPYGADDARAALDDLRRSGRVPEDAFVTDGAKFKSVDVVAPSPPPENTGAVSPAAAPSDETPKQARASEAELSDADRMALQSALKWYGFYNSSIDGAFGAGTRKSMAAWQEASGFEPTGVLTTQQRATLVANHAADLAEFGFETVTETEAGIEITLPLSLVSFDHYAPPFAHFTEKDGSGLQITLISEPGGVEALAGLYDILQTLEAVPITGPRERKETSFTIEGTSDKVQSYAYAETRDGTVKGYLVAWKPADAARMQRILPALQASFRGLGDKALDPGLVPIDEATKAGMLSGLEFRQPKSVASGFFVDDKGHVATSLANVGACAKLTLGLDTEAGLIAQDAATGLALLAATSPMVPQAVAQLASANPAPGIEIAVAGYSYGARLPAPVLTFGRLDAAAGLTEEPGFLRLAAPLMAGDMGGPVLDTAGRVLGLAIPVPADSAKHLPQGMALAAGSAPLAALLQGAGIVTPAPVQGSSAALSPDALNTAALGMTVQVACWDE